MSAAGTSGNPTLNRLGLLEQRCLDERPHAGHEWWFSKKANYWCDGASNLHDPQPRLTPRCWECHDTGGHWQHTYTPNGTQRDFAYCPAGCDTARARWITNTLCAPRIAAEAAAEADANNRDRIRRARAWADEVAGKGAA